MPAELESGNRQVEDGFHVHDAETANWVVRKIVEARQYARHVKAWAEMELHRAGRDEQFLLHRFGAELEAWARQQIDRQHDHRQSTNLPSGCIGFRTEPIRLAVTDEQRLLAWCRINLPSAIRVVESVAKTPLMQHVKLTGECPDGTELQGGGKRFHISSKSGEILKKPQIQEGDCGADSEQEAG